MSVEREVTLIAMHSLFLGLAEAVGEPVTYEGGGDWLYFISCVELHLCNTPQEGRPCPL